MMNNLRNARNFVLSFASCVFSLIAVIGLISALAASSNRSVSGAAGPGVPLTKTARKTMRSFGSEDDLERQCVWAGYRSALHLVRRNAGVSRHGGGDRL